MAKKKNDINAQIFYALKVSEDSKVPFLFMSAPGMGKSTSVSMFAKLRGYKLEILRGNSTSETEVMGYDVVDVDNPENKSTIHKRPSWYDRVLKNHENGHKTLLFLDEITTCPEHVQSALLHLIFERMVGNEPIPEDTLIVSAGNYAQSLSNQFQLLPPLMNRFCIFNIIPEDEDLSLFLSKYKGSIAGKKVDIEEVTKKKLKEMDEAESTEYDESTLSKFGEYIELGIYETTHMLQTSGEKVVNLKVTDVQNVYSDTDNDQPLRGFVSLRTLCYLRDTALSAFKLFGKNGIVSDNFQKIIEGLCGVGISRGSTGEIKYTTIVKNYYDSMCSVIVDIEKMKNQKLPEYEKYFNEALDKKDKGQVESGELKIINEKIKEMMNDPDVNTLECPINSAIISKLCKVLDNNSNIGVTISAVSSDIFSCISSDKFIGIVTKWNVLLDLYSSIHEIVNNPTLKYRDITKTELEKLRKKLKKVWFQINTIYKLMVAQNSTVDKLIPTINNKFMEF